MLLSHHAQPFIPSSLHTPTGLVPTHAKPLLSTSRTLSRRSSKFLFQTDGLCSALEQEVLSRSLHGPSIHLQRSNGEDLYIEDREIEIDSPPYRGPNYGLLPSLSKSPKEILATEKAARSFKPPLKITQIQEAVNLGQLSHLMKGIKKERTKSSDTTKGESKKDKGVVPAEAPILMKLNPAIKATTVDLKTPLVGFSRERSWSVGEVPLEITIGDAPLSRTETLNFVIVRSDSSHIMLLGRTTMQRIGIVVSTIHGAIKFHTEKRIRTVFSIDEVNKVAKRAREIPTTNKERILSCVNAKEKIIINDKYPDQTVTIGRQLPNHFKKELQNLLKSNTNVFAWTHADMTGILRTIMVRGKPFHTEHKLNEYNHINPIKQNKRGLGPDCNMAACKEIEELMKAGILRKVKHQTWVANPVTVKKSDGG
ncbi:hypothetical protein Tco_0597263 [Tanacetum coccineum]